MPTPNLIIRPEDIRANPELWIQKISVILFNDPTGKNYWNRNYAKIPHYQRYNEAMKWLKETEFEEYNCRIIKNENNEIELVTKNAFGKPAEIHWKQQDIIRKIKKKVREEINNAETRSPKVSINPISQPQPKTRTQPTNIYPLKPNPVKLAKWKNINPNFTEPMINEWEKANFAWEQTKEWIDIGLTGNDADFCAWLRSQGKTAEWCLNYGNLEELREEYERQLNSEE